MFKSIRIIIAKTMMEHWKRIARDSDRVYKEIHAKDAVIKLDDPIAQACINSYARLNTWSRRYSKLLYGYEGYFKILEES